MTTENVEPNLNAGYLGRNLYINAENGVVSLEDENELDIDISNKLFIKTTDNLKLELKYPSMHKMKPLSASVASLIGDYPTAQRATNPNFFGKYLKNVYMNVKPIDERHDRKQRIDASLCEKVLGIYPNLAFDPISNDYKLIVQGIVPNSKLSKQQILKIGMIWLF